jgi:hypothetical protein
MDLEQKQMKTFELSQFLAFAHFDISPKKN